MICAVYLRKSRAEEDDPDALRKHRKTLFEFAEKNSLSIVDVFEEIFSGEVLYLRSEMMKLLENIDSSMYDAVLCMDIDRLGRGAMSSQGIILETFKRADCKIITPRRVYDLNNELDEQYTEFEAFMARQEYKLIKKRLIRGRDRAAREGTHQGEPPFGYERDIVNRVYTLKIDEEKAKLVREMFNMYAYKNVGCQIIANMMNASSVKPRTTASWHANSIRRMLQNPIYTGTLRWNVHKHKRPSSPSEKHKLTKNPENEWVVVENAVPAIIDLETYERVQVIFKNKLRSSYYTGAFSNPLAGIVFCAACGKLMQRHYAKHEKYPRIYCQNTACCKGSRLDFVEIAILDRLETMYKEIVANIQTIRITKSENNVAFLDALNVELKRLHSQRENLYNLLEQGVYTIDVFTERSRVLATREIEIKEEIDRALRISKQEDMIDQRIHKLGQVIENYPNETDIEKKNEYLRSVIDKVTYTRQKSAQKGQFDISIKLHGL